MSRHAPVVDAFTGASEARIVRVRHRNTVRRIYVGFGEIRIPTITKNSVDIASIEDEHECRILRMGNRYVIIPRVVREIIEKENVLCSMSDAHRKRLEEWLTTYGVKIIKYLIF